MMGWVGTRNVLKYIESHAIINVLPGLPWWRWSDHGTNGTIEYDDGTGFFVSLYSQ